MAKNLNNEVEGRTRPEANSLRLLPLGPDRIGEAIARADLPRVDIEGSAQNGKVSKIPVTSFPSRHKGVPEA